jgi:hypothetical protein
MVLNIRNVIFCGVAPNNLIGNYNSSEEHIVSIYLEVGGKIFIRNFSNNLPDNKASRPTNRSPKLFKSVLSSHRNCISYPAGRSPSSRHETNFEQIREQCKLKQVYIQAVLIFYIQTLINESIFSIIQKLTKRDYINSYEPCT